MLTDIEGTKKFATVLTYHREFYCCENTGTGEEKLKSFDLVNAYNETEDETEEKKNYVLVFLIGWKKVLLQETCKKCLEMIDFTI